MKAGSRDLLDAHSVTITVVGRMKPTGSPWDRAVTIPVEQVWMQHHLPSGHEPAAQHLGPPFDAAYTPGIPMAVLQVSDLATAYKLRSAYNNKESMAFFPAETDYAFHETLIKGSRNKVIERALLLELYNLIKMFRYKKAVIIKKGDNVENMSAKDIIYYDKAAGHEILLKDEPHTIILERDVVVVL